MERSPLLIIQLTLISRIFQSVCPGSTKEVFIGFVLIAEKAMNVLVYFYIESVYWPLML